LTTDINYGKGLGNWRAGGQWLSGEYHESINYKIFPLQVLVDGIMAFIKDHELEKLNKIHQTKTLEWNNFKEEYLKNVQQSWADLIEFLGITDEDIREILDT